MGDRTMSTSPRKRCTQFAHVLSDLSNGDSLTQQEFHARYQLMPVDYRAELLDGIVYVCEPLSLEHGEADAQLVALVVAYRAATCGVAVHQNSTIVLGPKDEVQPDLFLRILPEYGGQSGLLAGKKVTFAKGAPEFIAEVAHSSRAIDLHLKKERYAQAGVQEYLVLCLKPLELYWFDLQNGKKLERAERGVFMSEVFPGLWVDEQALLSNDYYQMMDVLSQGLETAEHKEFVARLADRRLADR